MERIKKGDTVEVISGKDKGRRGKILEVIPDEVRVLVEGINIYKRHIRPSQQSRGGVVDKPLPLHASKVMPVCPHCSKPTRVYTTHDADKNHRVCGECEKVMDSK